MERDRRRTTFSRRTLPPSGQAHSTHDTLSASKYTMTWDSPTGRIFSQKNWSVASVVPAFKNCSDDSASYNDAIG